MNLPLSSSGNKPVPYVQAGFPKECDVPGAKNIQKAKELIEAYEKGKISIDQFPCDDSVPGIWQTWGANGSVVPIPGGEINTPGQYGFKFLSDRKDSTPLGISARFGPYDNIPHYHREPEWFYVLQGEALLNVGGSFHPFKKGDIVYFEENVIHDMIIVKPELFVHFWGFPFDPDWKSYAYYTRENTRENEQIQRIFDEVDEMRTAAGIAPNPKGDRSLKEGVVPVALWWEKNKDRYAVQADHS